MDGLTQADSPGCGSPRRERRTVLPRNGDALERIGKRRTHFGTGIGGNCHAMMNIPSVRPPAPTHLSRPSESNVRNLWPRLSNRMASGGAVWPFRFHRVFPAAAGRIVHSATHRHKTSTKLTRRSFTKKMPENSPAALVTNQTDHMQ